jgi:hypothetical protein
MSRVKRTLNDVVVEFDTAKLAKEKGFELADKFMPNYYNYEGNFKGDSVAEIKEFMQHKKAGTPNPGIFSNTHAPTQSGLQAWLRNEKGLVVWVDPSQVSIQGKVAVKYTWCMCNLNGEVIDEDETPLGFDTWEIALEIGLWEALNKI